MPHVTRFLDLSAIQESANNLMLFRKTNSFTKVLVINLKSYKNPIKYCI